MDMMEDFRLTKTEKELTDNKAQNSKSMNVINNIKKLYSLLGSNIHNIISARLDTLLKTQISPFDVGRGTPCPL